MDVETATQIWMGGVIAFGIVFYAFAMRHAKHCDKDQQEEDR